MKPDPRQLTQAVDSSKAHRAVVSSFASTQHLMLKNMSTPLHFLQKIYIDICARIYIIIITSVSVNVRLLKNALLLIKVIFFLKSKQTTKLVPVRQT